MDGCLEVFPRSGTMDANGYAFVRLVLTGSALELPAGQHAALLVLSSQNTTTSCPLSIKVVDPARLAENGGFEDGWNGWTSTGNATLETGPTYVPFEGNRIAAFNSSNSTPNGSISCTIPTEAGAR